MNTSAARIPNVGASRRPAGTPHGPRRIRRLLALAGSALALWLAAPAGDAAPVTLSSLLAEMTDPAAVARFPEPAYQCLQASSYNRASTHRTQPDQGTSGWFADSDGLGFLRTETRGERTEWVILEHRGPGCLTKLWTPNFYYGFEDRRGPNVRIYLDDQSVPAVDESLIEWVTGKGSFEPPLCAPTARAGNSYLPIPFARSCKVVMTAKPFYYLISYRAYTAGTPVETFTREGYQAARAELLKAAEALTADAAAHDGSRERSATLAPGAQLAVPLPAGPRAVQRLSLRLPASANRPEVLRSTVLALTFDAAETVWCPLGDFFCSADALHPIRTWQRTVTPQGILVCRWIMPYEKAASARLLNLGREAVDVALSADTAPWAWDERSLHFYARWRPDDVVHGTPFQDWNFVDIRGPGVFVGDAWTVLNPQGSWWGEGDEKIYVDAAWDRGFPTHFGTGTEDYYGWAGGEVPTRRDEFTGPFLANARVGGVDGGTTGFNVCTRTRSLDAIPFRERLVFDMESSFGTDIRQPWNLLGYSAVTFFYARPGAAHNRPACAAEASRPVMALADLQAKSDAIRELLQGHRGEAAVLFTESRESPLRRGEWPGVMSLRRRQGRDAAFAAEARPGEFLVFQVGVYAFNATDPLRVTFEDLRGDAGTLPAGAFRCLSLAGTNDLGLPFAKNVALQPGELQPLWIGLAVPANTTGTFTGKLSVQVAPGTRLPVHLNVRVAGEAVPDAGDSTAKHLSRLRWLDSTVGSEPTLTKPFTAVQCAGRRIRVLGRELELGEDGLPAQLRSYFSAANTRLQPTPRPLLSRPTAFVVETAAGPLSWQSKLDAPTVSELEATWTAHSQADGLRADLTGRLDFTGSGELNVRLSADRDIELTDARLEIPFRADVARFFMGLDHPGGRRPDAVHWTWDVTKRQDCFWLGDVNAGLMWRLKDAAYVRPLVNIYYAFRPLQLPASWGNAGRGGVDVQTAPDGGVLARAYSGPRRLKAGQSLDFIAEFYLTPFRTLDTEQQWATRFTHLGGPGRQPLDEALAAADAEHGPNVLNVHHASFYSPYINYPYSDESFPAFCDLVRRAHARGIRLRVYYTTREITQNLPELLALHSLRGEIIFPGPGREARTLLHPQGPHRWLTENLRGDFVPAWEAQVGAPYADLDLSVITTPDSRWNNFYLQGLQWLVEQSDFDGMYIDDTALNAASLRRARRILDSRPGRLIDLHTWNHFNPWAGFANNLSLYMEVLPYLDRLWLGEGFDANAAAPDFWLVEMSGLPFGVMSEMLDGANPWRGMVFGETARLPWSGDPRGLWRSWDEFGLPGTEMLPYFLDDCPVRTDAPDVLATVYRKPGRSFVALGSWAETERSVRLSIDWKALGLDPTRATLHAPAIAGMQTEHTWNPDDPIAVAPQRGWFLILDEVRRPAAQPQPNPDPESR